MRRTPTIKGTRYVVRHGCHDCLHAMIHWPDGGDPFRRCDFSSRTVQAAGWCARHERRQPQKRETVK